MPRSTVVSVVAIVIGALFVIVGVAAGGTSGEAVTMADLDIAVPGAIVAVAMLVTHVAGRLNLALGGAYAVLVVLLGASPAPGDLRVIAVGAMAILLALLTGFVINEGRTGTLGAVLLYFVTVDLSLRTGGATSRTSSLHESWILSTLSGEIGPVPRTVVAAVLATAATSFLLSYSDFGRRTRAFGLDRERLALVGGTRTPDHDEASPAIHEASSSWSRGIGSRGAIRSGVGSGLFHLSVLAGSLTGVLLSLAGTSSLVRLGTSGTPSVSLLLLRPLAAVVIGNGGLGRSDPSPARVFIAYLLIHIVLAQLRVEGLSSVTSDLAVAALALVVLVVSRDRH